MPSVVDRIRRYLGRSRSPAPPPPASQSIAERLGAQPFMHLEPGARYTVIKPFTDYDRSLHPVGETWTYLTKNFVPYDDGLSLFVSADGEAERQIRLQWRAEEQAAIIDGLKDYVTRV